MRVLYLLNNYLILSSKDKRRLSALIFNKFEDKQFILLQTTEQSIRLGDSFNLFSETLSVKGSFTFGWNFKQGQSDAKLKQDLAQPV